MNAHERPPSLEELTARLRRARGRKGGEEGSEEGGEGPPLSGLGLAFRVGVELVAALIVGLGIGLLVDRWLGISPWGLVVFVILGIGAGIMNVYRTVSGYGAAVGYPRGEEEEEEEEDEGNGNGPQSAQGGTRRGGNDEREP